MSSKCYSKCAYHLPISAFFKDALTGPGSRVYSTCIRCREQQNKKRAALRSLDPNIQPVKRVCRPDGLLATVHGP